VSLFWELAVRFSVGSGQRRFTRFVALAPVPFSSTIYLFAEAILRVADENVKAQMLPAVAAGDIIGTLAFAEGIGFPRPHRIKLRFENGRLHGEKWPVADAVIANPLTMPAIYYAAYKLGAWLLGTKPLDVEFEASWTWFTQSLDEIWLPLLVGSQVMGIILGIFGYLLIDSLWRNAIRRQWQARRRRRSQ
jgi:hypothetical protein